VPRYARAVKKLSIDIWSDVVCPWCYVGKRRLEAALARFAHRGAVEITWRAFELDPRATRAREPSGSHAERIAAKYRTSVAQAEAMIRRITDTGAAEGIDFHFDRARTGNTFDAHRVIHLAAARGLGDAAKERLMRAYFTDGEPIADRETLIRLAGEIGLDRDEVRTALSGDAYAEEVRGDEAEARALEIRGVPFFVIGRYGVSGAQPPDVLLRVLDEAWDELDAPLAVDDVAACGPEGCAS